MPEPDWADTDYDPWEQPDTASEILGRGVRQRRSKTFLQNHEHAMVLSTIAGHTQMLKEAFRHLNARQNTVEVVVTDEEGNEHVKNIPEVLSDDQLRHRFPIIRVWERRLEEAQGHAASVGGYSISAVSHYDAAEGKKGKRRGDSSAGTDKGGSRDQVRWK